jgi:hypothetical protein
LPLDSARQALEQLLIPSSLTPLASDSNKKVSGSNRGGGGRIVPEQEPEVEGTVGVVSAIKMFDVLEIYPGKKR